MLELFGWSFGITAWAAFLLLIGALVIGAIFQYIGDVTIGYEWAVAGLGALIGAWVASESLGTLGTWGPEWEGLFLLPALIGAIVLAFVVDLLARTATGGSYVHHPRPI